MSIVSNIVFAFVVLGTGVVVYWSYVANLRERIWKTKTMLNMVPLSILEGNGRLRSHILKGEIF